jgi:hypothetical protein
MERKKSEQRDEKSAHRRAEPAQRQTAPIAQPAGRLPERSMAALADALFDLHLDENQGGRPDAPPPGLANLPGLERLIGIVGPCAIPGCDVHLLSEEKAFGLLEGGGIGVGLRILSHIAAGAPIEPALANARKYWSGSPHPAAVAVLVYTDRERVLMVDGTEAPLR